MSIFSYLFWIFNFTCLLYDLTTQSYDVKSLVVQYSGVILK